jgi:hypothetical protein
MANLIGYLNYDRHAKQLHRLSNRNISAKVATWHTSAEVKMDKYGRVTVFVERNGVVVKKLHYDKSELSKSDMELIERQEERARERLNRARMPEEVRVAKIDRVLENGIY